MATDLSEQQFIGILSDPEITRPLDIDMLQSIYSFEGHKAPASQIGRQLGYTGKYPGSPLNLEVGNFAKRIAKKYDIEYTTRANMKYKYWDLFFNGWNEGRLFIWELKPNLIIAMQKTGLTGDLNESTEIPETIASTLIEGAKRTITVNAYERNPQARKKCVNIHGCKCVVCGFDFEETYGEIGKGYIHVHHLTPISEIGNEYEIVNSHKNYTCID